jgi:hypothetical protein
MVAGDTGQLSSAVSSAESMTAELASNFSGLYTGPLPTLAAAPQP